MNSELDRERNHSPAPCGRGLGGGVARRQARVSRSENHALAPQAHVKFLRQNQTRAEYRLWTQLRGKRICGRRFRRQFRLDRYIVDLVCLSVRLAVEVDGPSHDLTADQDALRTRRLEAQGYRVIRFSNEDVMRELDSVVRTIEAAVIERLAEGVDDE